MAERLTTAGLSLSVMHVSSVMIFRLPHGRACRSVWYLGDSVLMEKRNAAFLGKDENGKSCGGGSTLRDHGSWPPLPINKEWSLDRRFYTTRVSTKTFTEPFTKRGRPICAGMLSSPFFTALVFSFLLILCCWPLPSPSPPPRPQVVAVAPQVRQWHQRQCRRARWLQSHLYGSLRVAVPPGDGRSRRRGRGNPPARERSATRPKIELY